MQSVSDDDVRKRHLVNLEKPRSDVLSWWRTVYSDWEDPSIHPSLFAQKFHRYIFWQGVPDPVVRPTPPHPNAL